MQNPGNPDGTLPPAPESGPGQAPLPPGQWAGPPPPPQGQWAGPPPQGQWGAPPPPNNTTRNVLIIVGVGLLALCVCAGVYTLITLSLLGGAVNNIFSSIASSLGTPTP